MASKKSKSKVAAGKAAAVRRVLVVEDDEAVRGLIECTLQESGFRTVAASNAEETFARMREEPARVVLLDLNLVGESGLDFLPRLKKEHPGAAVIVLTGMGYDHNTIKAAVQSGADGYFSKEIGFKNLVPVIEKFFGDGVRVHR